MDTGGILFICGGAFIGLEKIIQRRLGNRVMGFGAVEQGHKITSVDRDKVLQFVEPEDLIAFGFIPEFVGRLPMTTVLEELTEEQLVSILTETKNALVRQYAKLLAMEGIELEFTEDAVRELAAQAMKKGTGARALRSLLEKLMLDVMFESPPTTTLPASRSPARSCWARPSPCSVAKPIRPPPDITMRRTRTAATLTLWNSNPKSSSRAPCPPSRDPASAIFLTSCRA